MARPTKYATPICIGLTVLAAIGAVIGVLTENSLVAILLLLPAVGYEVYRTEGESTRWASWAMLATFVALLIFSIFDVEYDLAAFFGESEKYVAGRKVPLGDIKVVASALMIVLGIVLFTRTRGVYTRWLAIIILVASFAIVFILSPDTFKDLLRSGVDEVVQ